MVGSNAFLVLFYFVLMMFLLSVWDVPSRPMDERIVNAAADKTSKR
jgi:hypothetical protein